MAVNWAVGMRVVRGGNKEMRGTLFAVKDQKFSVCWDGGNIETFEEPQIKQLVADHNTLDQVVFHTRAHLKVGSEEDSVESLYNEIKGSFQSAHSRLAILRISGGQKEAANKKLEAMLSSTRASFEKAMNEKQLKLKRVEMDAGEAMNAHKILMNELSRERAERGKIEALARVEAKARQRAEADTINLMRKLESFNEQFSIQMQMRKTAEQALATEVQSRSLSEENVTREMSSRLSLEQEILRLRELLKVVEDERVHASQDAIRAANAALMLETEKAQANELSSRARSECESKAMELHTVRQELMQTQSRLREAQVEIENLNEPENPHWSIQRSNNLAQEYEAKYRQVWRQQTEAMSDETAQLKLKINQLQQFLNESQRNAEAMADKLKQLEAEREKFYLELQVSARETTDREKSLNQSKAELQAASMEIMQLRSRLSQVEVLEMELESSKLRQQDLETKLKRQTLQMDNSPDRIRLGASSVQMDDETRAESKGLELAVVQLSEQNRKLLEENQIHQEELRDWSLKWEELTTQKIATPAFSQQFPSTDATFISITKSEANQIQNSPDYLEPSKGSKVYVLQVVPGGAADISRQIAADDALLLVNGESIEGLHLDDVFAKIQGIENSEVTLTFSRFMGTGLGDQVYSITLKRRRGDLSTPINKAGVGLLLGKFDADDI